MAWTERRKRKVLAVVDGITGFLFVVASWAFTNGFVRWVVNLKGHHPEWHKVFETGGYKLIVAIMPEEAGIMVVMVCLPLGFGFLSYACDESLISKVFRWFYTVVAVTVLLASSPIFAMHSCLCGAAGKGVGKELVLPALSVLFLVTAYRQAHRRWSTPEATTSPASEVPAARPSGDGPPSP